MELFARSPKKSLPFALAIGIGDGKVKKILIYIRYIEALARVPLFCV